MSETTHQPDPRELVARLADDGQRRDLIYQQLVACGPPALEAVREGLRHGH